MYTYEPHSLDVDPREEKIARDTLERYSGSSVEDFQPYLLLTNFPKYVHYFAEKRNIPIVEGSMFKVSHSVEEKITILDFKIGSPAAALVVDLCAYLPIRAALLLGMCGGLRKNFAIGNYFVPIAGIRGEGTSDFYFPTQIPAMANFLVQKVVTNVLEDKNLPYHIGITHTTNKRFWEFNRSFREQLEISRAQAIEMECATLFMASYYYKLPLGALLLISDLPLAPNGEGIKTKKSSEGVYAAHTANHVELGVEVMKGVDISLGQHAKGAFRGYRRRYETEPPLT